MRRNQTCLFGTHSQTPVTDRLSGRLFDPSLPLCRILCLRKASPLHNLVALPRPLLRLLHLGHRRRHSRPSHRLQRNAPHHRGLWPARLLRALLARRLPPPLPSRLRRRRQPPRRRRAIPRIPARRAEQSAHAAECVVARGPAREQPACVVVHRQLARRSRVAVVCFRYRHHHVWHVCGEVLCVSSL